MKNAKIMLGIKKFTSKAGKDFAVLQIAEPFTDREAVSGCVGSRGSEIFCPDDLRSQADSLVIGKPIDLVYDVVGGRAYLVGFSSIK